MKLVQKQQTKTGFGQKVQRENSTRWSGLLTLLFVFTFYWSWGQTGSISGKVTLENGTPAISAHVQVNGTELVTVSGVEGDYSISNVPVGQQILTISFLGYEPYTLNVEVKEGENTANAQLKNQTTELQSVTVTGKSKTTEIEEKPFTVNAIDVRPLKAQNLDINQVLNTTSGVRIREEGGLGSSFDFTLNGFSGNQVKFFLDGIPMDNFGTSLTMNNIPVNLISTIEVYKGVVPIELGADALGGAVNITTDNSIKKYLNVSYSFGSFNTHRAALSARYTTKKGLFVKTNAFFNYSDNNYTIEAEVADPVTGKYGDPEEIERFHDAYRSESVQLEFGVEDKKFADLLSIGFIASGNYKEIQTGSNMNKVVGEAFTTDKSLIPTLKYQKKNLFLEGLDVRFNAIYNIREAKAIDTASKIYNWYGDYTDRGEGATSGELYWDKTEFRFNDDNVIAMANVSYSIGKYQSIALNNTYSWYRRVGEDPISYNAVPFSEPNILEKNITGLSYSVKLFDERLRGVLFGKNFMFNADTKEGLGGSDNYALATHSVSEMYQGYGAALTYFIFKGLQIKGSYENTYRLPEAYEMFGDGLRVLPSAELTAEKSQNFNLGLIGRKRFNQHEFLLELGYLYRLPENLIRKTITGTVSIYENLSSAKANIYEAGIKYRYKDFLQFKVNGSYQDIVNNQKYTSTGGENYLYGDRIPNMPFLFGNAELGVQFKDVFLQESSLALNWSTLFVEAFYLNWPSQGSSDSKYDIPRQISHAVSATYALKDGQYSVSLACTNLFDQKLYDNFMLQKPGRAFSVKLSYFLM